jgi:malate dehydrogenase (oxaloacetate-decarboxylating)(NADP+)
MFYTAAKALSEMVSDEDLAKGALMPPIEKIRDISANIAFGVASEAFALGLATKPKPDDLKQYLKDHMFEPGYPSLA